MAGRRAGSAVGWGRGAALAALAASWLALGQGVADGNPQPSGSAASLVAPGGLRERAQTGTAPRIVGGQPTTGSEYPWQAALVLDGSRFAGSDFDRQLCGASLIHPDIVLTAAHCVYDTDPNCSLPSCGSDPGGDGTYFLDPNDVDVIIGRTRLSGSGGVEENAFNVYLNGAYDPVTGANDFALISLDPGGVALKRIKLAGADERALWDPGRLQRVSGYGSTFEGGNGTDVLRVARVPIVADSTCESPRFYGGDFLSAVMVCAGYAAGGVDSCQGDSGGPLQAPTYRGTLRETGLVASGNGCAEANNPGVYTRVAGTVLRPAVQSLVRQIENAEGPPVDRNLSVIGHRARLPFGCHGKGATIAGFGHRDLLTGTPGRDVIVGLSGNDVIRGLGGRDLICGGRGRDRILGGRGADRILGGAGADRLRGGAGRDRCDGGPGHDKAHGCERRGSL
jgi:hypothetical protein